MRDAKHAAFFTNLKRHYTLSLEALRFGRFIRDRGKGGSSRLEAGLAKQTQKAAPKPQVYNVYKIKEHLEMPDPEEAQTRYHTTIVVQINTPRDGDGFVHEVTGDIATAAGMSYLRRASHDPSSSASFYKRDFLGQVSVSQYPDSFEAVCKSVPPPHCQKRFNVTRMRYEAFKRDGSFYEEGELRPGYFKCTEWVEEKVVPKLQAEKILIAGPGSV